MGVVNVTPDSFSDGGASSTRRPRSPTGALLAAEGADLLDVGGESTRPGAEPVGASEELRAGRAGVEAARGRRLAPVSIDTRKAAVARAALEAGATLRQRRVGAARRPGDGRRGRRRGRRAGASMHMQGEPRTMQDDPRYDDVVRGGAGVPRRAAGVAVGAGHRRGARLARPRDRLRQDARAQPRAAAPPGRDRRDRPAGGGRRLAQAVPRHAHRARAGRERLAGTLAAGVLAFERGARCSACTTSRPTRDALAVAAATLAGETSDRRVRGARLRRKSESEDDGSSDADVKIEITGLSLFTHHGVSDAEQRGRASGSCSTSASASSDCDATVTDRIEDTIDYAAVCQAVALVATERSYRTLERLCTAVADMLEERFRPPSVVVRAAKPEPPIPLPVEEVAVEVER